MVPQPTTTPKASQAIGKLCVGGDWATAHGDFGGLQYIARQLADYMPEPILCALEELAAACCSDPDRAAAIWDELKARLYREARG